MAYGRICALRRFAPRSHIETELRSFRDSQANHKKKRGFLISLSVGH